MSVWKKTKPEIGKLCHATTKAGIIYCYLTPRDTWRYIGTVGFYEVGYDKTDRWFQKPEDSEGCEFGIHGLALAKSGVQVRVVLHGADRHSLGLAQHECGYWRFNDRISVKCHDLDFWYVPPTPTQPSNLELAS